MEDGETKPVHISGLKVRRYLILISSDRVASCLWVGQSGVLLQRPGH